MKKKGKKKKKKTPTLCFCKILEIKKSSLFGGRNPWVRLFQG
jgi:hypothetical protein